MGFLRNFFPNEMGYFKIYHKNYRNFSAIGMITEYKNELNICKVSFKDVNGKQRNYWFHLFTGNVVTLPRKEGQWAKDVDSSSEKAYCLSKDIVRPYDLDPKMDINYKTPEEKESEQIEEDEDTFFYKSKLKRQRLY